MSKRQPFKNSDGSWSLQLANGEHALLDEVDIEKVSRWSWCKGNRGYARTRIQNKDWQLHRYILDAPPELVVDHINGNPLDNRRSNLRLVRIAQNRMNTKVKEGKKYSKFKGVTNWRGRYWTVGICHQGVRKRIYCPDEITAAKAYDKMARDAYGAHARLNFPQPHEQSAFQRVVV